MIATCPPGPKKPLRLYEMKFPNNDRNNIRNNIELDSLEGGDDCDHHESEGDDANEESDGTNHDSSSSPIGAPVNLRFSSVKHLNLNSVCKNQGECYVDEIVLPSESLQSLSELKVLSLRNNDIRNFPNSVLQLVTLVVLDISDNCLLTIPPEINQLVNLQELILNQNFLSILPAALWDLKFLKILKVASNRLALPPDKHSEDSPEMRALILAESELNPENRKTSTKDGLTTLNLRANRLKGHIILGNYTCLTHLDVSENNIEILDLSSVEQLEVLQCSRNSLTQLTLFGKNLKSVIAGNNRLKFFTTSHPPLRLTHLDISYNELQALPDWLPGCQEIRSIFASNNSITHMPSSFFCNDMPFLQTVQLAYNQLQYLPKIQRCLPIQELFLQNNTLSSLPENFFKFLRSLRVLNVSNNRLVDLPDADERLTLEKCFLTANCLIDSSVEKVAKHLCYLKTLHIAYNNLTSLNEECVVNWTELEELVLSGNKILRLPNNIGQLKHLSVLRVHSNLLQSIPKLSGLMKLRVLDLAHNQLDRIDLNALIPPNLKFLDLSCNSKLHVDCKQFNTYRTQRPMSLVDVSGKNRTSLPLTPTPYSESDLTDYSWSVGFSETSGSKSKLNITQIRLPAFCNTEALFGIFDGESNGNNPAGIDKVLPRILLEERTVKETAHNYMKYTMLSICRHLRSKGLKQGVNAIFVHILRPKQINGDMNNGFPEGLKKYMMKISSVGDMKVVLGKCGGPIRLLPVKTRKHLRANPAMPLTIPDPEVTEIHLDEQDEYMIMANKNLWEVINPENAIKEVSLQRNVILAAKRLQDLAQSFGAEENLSIIVVKFNLTTTDVDLLIRELRQTFKKNKYQSESSNSMCQPGCCCDTLNSDCYNCMEKLAIPPPMMLGEDRSSPSGQSEHACSDCNSSSKLFIGQLTKQQSDNSRLFRSVTPSLFESVEVKVSPERRSYRGVAKALKQRREEEKNRDDSDSALSEEQFKCWEYMLEQNTQMLFDKELNTLNRGLKNQQNFRSKTPSLSRSSPHLASLDTNNNNSNSGQHQQFLSKQFGSTRSFNPLLSSTKSLSKSSSRLTLDNKKYHYQQQLIGGPNAAYFGSLQRLMPYNLEYDFAVMHERGLVDSMDLDRMQQYWGVATTEL